MVCALLVVALGHLRIRHMAGCGSPKRSSPAIALADVNRRHACARRDARQAAEGAAPPVAEDGGGRPADRRHRPRLQQYAGDRHRLARSRRQAARRRGRRAAGTTSTTRMEGAKRAAAADRAAARLLAPAAAAAAGRSTSTSWSPACRSCCGARSASNMRIETVLAGGLWRTLRRSQPARKRDRSTSASMRATPCRTAAG